MKRAMHVGLVVAGVVVVIASMQTMFAQGPGGPGGWRNGGGKQGSADPAAIAHMMCRQLTHMSKEATANAGLDGWGLTPRLADLVKSDCSAAALTAAFPAAPSK